MKNIVKALIATTAIISSSAAHADFADVSATLGQYGVDATTVDFSTLTASVSATDGYSGLLVAEDSVANAVTLTDKLTALQALQGAQSAFEDDGAKISVDTVALRSAVDGIIEGAVATRGGELVSEVDGFLGQIDEATTGIVTDFVDGIIDGDADKATKASVGIDLLVFVAGGDAAESLVNPINYGGGVMGEFAGDLQTSLGLSDGFSVSDVKTAAKDASDIGADDIVASDFDFTVNADDTVSVSVKAAGYTGLVDNSSTKVKIYDLDVNTVTVNNVVKSGIYGTFTDGDNATQNVWLSNWIE